MSFAWWLNLGGLIAALAVLTFGPRAQTAQEMPAMAELQHTLRDRDAFIGELVQGGAFEWLGQRLATAPVGGYGRASASVIPAVAVAPLLPSKPSEKEGEPPVVPTEVAQQEVEPAAPGEFEVDEEAIERALERALIQTGALLLPVGRAEVEPTFSYVRRELDAPQLIVEDNLPVAAANELEQNEIEAGLVLRLGLPFDSQVEVDVPYRYEEINNIQRVNFAARREEERNAAGFGDVSVSFAKGLLREEGMLPNLIGRVRWESNSGETKDGVSLGNGFHEFTGSLTATKRQDPLVFVGSASYTSILEEDDADPGDQLGFTLGMVLAASPETSLRFLLAQSFSGELELGGREIEGTDQVSSSLIIGASSIIAPRVLLDVTAGIGLTEDAPDYSIKISLPIAFDLPFRF